MTGVCSGHGHLVGKRYGFVSEGRFSQHDTQDLRDDVTGALDLTVSPMRTSRRAISSALCKRRVLHHDAADRDRLELRNRRERAGAADLNVDAADDRGGALGRKFVRDCPARRARDKAQSFLPVEPVDLVDDAVDIVVERAAR